MAYRDSKAFTVGFLVALHNFSAQMRACRVGLGLTRKALADKVGMSETLLTEIEAARRISTARLQQILLATMR